MKNKTKILFVSQEITPYLKESLMGKVGRYLPQGIQESGKEMRSFMPRFGLINERRNQLHEVIRLSGMNLIIDDTDHPLIIKVASIQSARMQVYFIDNEDYFQRKAMIRDPKTEKFYDDNDERTVFFCRGVLETVKKLGWAPDIIHCNGWMSALVPLYVKTAYKDNPLFAQSKIVVNLFNDDFSEKFNEDWLEKIQFNQIDEEHLKLLQNRDYESLMKTAIDYADAIIMGEETINETIHEYAKSSKKPILDYINIDDEKYVASYNEFYDNLKEE